MLTGKKIVLGVTGSISAYKMANVASMLTQLHGDVYVVLTRNAAQFITPATFETLTKNPCLTDMFEGTACIDIPHIALGQGSDLILVAPASADILGKMACGIADDLLSSVLVAATCPVLVAPAMNTHMYQNPVVQENISRLKKFGYEFIEPAEGRLACGVSGPGKLPAESVLAGAVLRKLTGQEGTAEYVIRRQIAEEAAEEALRQNTAEEQQLPNAEGAAKRSISVSLLQEQDAGDEWADLAEIPDLSGMRILVTAGPTQESLDPVRYLTNHSTGKMGYAIAAQARRRGADVTLVTGPVNLEVPRKVKAVHVTTAEEMYREVMAREAHQDIIIKAAAVADYRPKQIFSEKIKKKDGSLFIELERTKDILAELGSKKRKWQCVCGFSMETERVVENSLEKLQKKNADMIAANSLREEGAGFGEDTNHLILITAQGEEDLGILPKEECADLLLDRLIQIWKGKQREESGWARL